MSENPQTAVASVIGYINPGHPPAHVAESRMLLDNPGFVAMASSMALVLERSLQGEVWTMRRDIAAMRRHRIEVRRDQSESETVKTGIAVLTAIAGGKRGGGFDYLLAKAWLNLRDILQEAEGVPGDGRMRLLKDMFASTALRDAAAPGMPPGAVMPVLVTLLLRTAARIEYMEASAEDNWNAIKDIHVIPGD